MKFQALSKELLGSFWMMIDADFVQELESMQLFGNATRVDTREQYRRMSEDHIEHVFRLSVYRPEELVVGTRCLVHAVKKSRKGTWLYKVVLIPNAEPWEEKTAELEQVEPQGFWEQAYWQYAHAEGISER